MLNRNRVSQQQRQHQQQHQQHFEIQRKQAKAERVRKLWVEFEQWLKQPRNEMEREREQLVFQTGRVTSAAVKASRRRIEGAHFYKAREEWQRRLRAADLRESDWDPMQEAEMKAVEEALGVDDEEGYITDPSPSPPHQILALTPFDHPAPSPSSFLPQPALLVAVPPPAAAPPLTASSSTSSSSSYECVRPEEFHSEDDEELTPDSDYSSFSSTISTIISEEDEAVGPVTEYMFREALESSGFTGRPQDTLINDKVPALTRATLSAPRLTENGSGGVPPLAPPKRPPDNKPTQSPVTKTTSAGSNNSPSPQSLPPATSASKSQGPSKPSRIHYPLVAPSLSDTSDYDEVGDDAETGSKRLPPPLVAQFEAQFESKKLQIRIDKIREFHQLACDADAQLCVNLANGRRGKTLTRQEEGKMVEEHYQWTVSLRERMEKERKEQVKQEQRRLRNELSRRNPVSSSTFTSHSGQGPRQGRLGVPIASQESDTDTEDELKHKLERMKQEQMALQAKYASFQPAEPMAQPHVARKRAGTLTSENAPPAAVRAIDSDHGSTPKPSGSAWSVKPAAVTAAAPRGLSNILNNVPKKTASPFDFTDPTAPLSIAHFDVDSVDQEADNEDDDNDDEQEKENAGFWSYLTPGQKKKAAPPVPSAPSPWNFAAGPPRAPQKPLNGKSRLGLVTSAWDDSNNNNNNDAFEGEDDAGPKEVEKEVEEKTPVIPSAPAPNVPANKKQTKKQRANKKGGTGKAEPAAPQSKVEVNANPPPPTAAAAAAATVQKGQQKSAPVSVPNKSGTGRKASLVNSDDLSSTPRPSVLKRLQAQLANEEAGSEHHDDDNMPTTPRPNVSKKPIQAGHNSNNNNNPWAKGFGKGASSSVLSHSGFDDDADEADFGAGNGKKSVASDASQVPGSWKWGGDNNSNNNNKARNLADLPSASASASAAATATRKGAAGRQPAASAAVSNGIEPETNKKKGKKAGNGQQQQQQRSAWGKRATVEEVPDVEGEDMISAGSQGESLPYNSRSILEPRDGDDEEDQPRILEPKPSKPRTMYENIFQYGEAGAVGAGVPDDLRDELGDWSEERLTSALARMAQESAEMDRRVNGLGPTSNAGVNGGAAAAAAMSMSMSKPGVMEQPPTSVPKKVRWQQSQQGFDAAATQSPALQAFAANKMVSRSYDDEAFSSSNAAIPAFHFGSYGGQQTNGGWPAVNNNHQYGNPFAAAAAAAESEDDELARTARSLFENIHFAPQRNKPGFAAA